MNDDAQERIKGQTMVYHYTIVWVYSEGQNLSNVC